MTAFVQGHRVAGEFKRHRTDAHTHTIALLC